MSKISFVKKLTAGVVAVAMLLTAFAVIPKQADAAIAEDQVLYEEATIANYWKVDTKTAPVKPGYVFGGWFYETTEEAKGVEKVVNGETTTYYAPLTADMLNTDENNDCDYTNKAFAKFVPAQVLSVKAQNGVNAGGTLPTKASDINETNPIWVRLMTSLDSLNYDRIGFDIYLNNTKRPMDSEDNDYILETSKVFESVYVGDNADPTDATDIFGGVSEYVCVWELQKIKHESNATKIIYVRPYWYTMDGTKVLGLAKYVHIEDQYNDYISVPVNLLDGQDVAAGKAVLTYADTNAETASAWKVKDVEIGRVLPEMSAIVSDNTITMVGNAKTVNTYSTDSTGERETIFANVRFQRVEGTTDSENITFTTTMDKFCNWEPKAVTINSWDVKHYATESGNE